MFFYVMYVMLFRSVAKVSPSILTFCRSHSKFISGSIVSSGDLGHPNQIDFVFFLGLFSGRNIWQTFVKHLNSV